LNDDRYSQIVGNDTCLADTLSSLTLYI